MAQTGDYIIAVGGRHGVVKIGHKWCTFECSICMRAAGFLQNRIGTNDNESAAVKLGQTPPAYPCMALPKHK